MTQHSDFDATAEPFDWDALARYLAGESTPDEARAVRLWLDARPERAALVDALGRSLDRVAAEDAADVDVEAALAKVHLRMQEPALVVARGGQGGGAAVPRFAPRAQRTTAAWRRPAAWLAAAAAVAIAAVGIARVREGSREAPSAAVIAYTTAVGSRDSLRLADGSRVVLGPGSRLDVAAGFGGARRDVTLHGEAYFDVVHDGSRPFVVHAGPASIEDIGTAFTVRSDTATGVRVAVTAGRVRLSRAAEGGAGVILEAGDAATLDTTMRVARGAASADEALAFTRGRLVFREASLADVAADLRRWYGIELRVADSTLARRRLTATFERETPDQVLAVIGTALGTTATRQGSAWVLGAPVRGRAAGLR